MWATRGDAKPISQVYSDNGVRLTPAGKGPGSRVAGWQRIHSYLAEGPACVIHRAMGWETCPMIHFFRTLPKMWWELANLPHARKGDPEDADSNAPDHLCDTLRYWLLNLGGGAEAWLEWARRKVLEASGEPVPARKPGAEPEAAPEPEPEPAEPEAPLDPVTARKLARDAAFRAQQRR